MALTPYHALYYSWELTRKRLDGIARLGQTLHDAKVDLNPHQVDAALFALRSPLSKGVLLADEVGLGKTIEAGLVLCQLWAEQKRNLLVVCPASLRTQWVQELSEKFYLPARALDARIYRDLQVAGKSILDDDSIVNVCSYQFVSRMKDMFRQIPWHLVVIDEAHNLRNAWRPRNILGQNIRETFQGVKKILLTATPLQNNLIELYGLTSLIDENIFGEASQFRKEYQSDEGSLDDLKVRITPYVQRTLRRQVLEYIKYTKRNLLTVPFVPTNDEQSLYDDVSIWLSREELACLSGSRRELATLVLRKLLASSSYAVAQTFHTLRLRLEALRDRITSGKDLSDMAEDLFTLDEDLAEELAEDTEDAEAQQAEEECTSGETAQEIEITIETLEKEIKELSNFEDRASSIKTDSKSRALLIALQEGFASMRVMGANEKAVVFTESRRTQEYLRLFLTANGYEGRIVTFNGTNTDPESSIIYDEWVQRYRNTERASGVRQIDIRTALLDRFRESAAIFLATGAGAEGVNLQFASLLVNYDLPWNPQRVEQRIGRVHRYGQKFDVVVINFLNKNNQADQRVLELLTEKFSLFRGVFGASDEVLGSIESGFDFERRILDIYQHCRSPEEIAHGFSVLRDELESQIANRMASTRSLLMEHFDEDVHERLKGSLTDTRDVLDRSALLFRNLSAFILKDHARFVDNGNVVILEKPLSKGISAGTYTFDREGQGQRIAFGSPLGRYILETAKNLAVTLCEVTFEVSNHFPRVTMLEPFAGMSGWLSLSLVSFSRPSSDEEFLVFSGCTDSGASLDQERLEKFFRLEGKTGKPVELPDTIRNRLDEELDCAVVALSEKVVQRQNAFFDEERERLDRWADDQVRSLETELEQVKKRILEVRRSERQAATLDAKTAFTAEINRLERKKKELRMSIFDEEDAITERRDALVASMRAQLSEKRNIQNLYTIRWSIQ